ncbi:SDR family NAD(P)-dependent oxidoreductase [Halorhodospira halophila]|uniref:Short-chain dehydrogenase/reductase SDR n=1 Tax=Halorhodospira halophila (strain DSM 244 / SL1) TaxID=349124 RepID=A1WWN4_HALHL|nr:SDR family NAD(P)-dependent oxidoreductase [Halorhodospira halophila]ABM62096.1 short-chain dehydrogenase/reductase SDR [Halorhodospira halophila SL1]MBK1729424.1 hypothetical protein [Halorhodospira halophila]
MRKPHEWLLDASIYFSFDRSGSERHARTWPGFRDRLRSGPDEALTGLVTGGSRGIGAAAVHRLRGMGHRVLSCGRSEQAEDTDYRTLDTGDWAAVARTVETLPPLDFIALNAGAMPERFTLNADGVELQMASQLFGHYLLVHNLARAGKLREGARVVWMSSGGMYLQRLHLRHLFENDRYDKVATYANVKRAQTIVNAQMARMPLFRNVGCFAMHPGWVDTAGVREAIPGFWRWTQGRLRTPEQGADTLVWLVTRASSGEGAADASSALESGGFYFDRRRVSPYLVPGTRETATEREALLEYLERLLAPYQVGVTP